MSIVVVFVVGLIVTGVLAVPIGLVIWASVHSTKQKRLRREHAHASAARFGFAVDTTTKPPPDIPFKVFGVGSSRLVTSQFWRPNSMNSVFDYQYTVSQGSGETRSSSTTQLTCALVRLPFHAPPTRVGREGSLSSLGRVFGLDDIQTESESFNDSYHLVSADERFAIAMFDPPTIDWFNRFRPLAGGAHLEFVGPWMLCIEKRMDIDQQFSFLEWAERFPAYLPAVLSSLYPVTP